MTNKLTKIILSILFIYTSIVYAQNDTVNYTDDNNLKQGHWIFTNKEKNLPGYKDDQVVEEGRFKDNRKNGKWYFYFVNEKVKQMLTYQNNRPNGYAVFYYKNGNVREEGLWKNNRWVGEYKYYYENGNLKNHWKYNEQGQRSGEQKYYHENGNLMIKGDWDNGKESGTITEYYENGSVKSQRIFNDGKLNAEESKQFKKKDVKEVIEQSNEISVDVNKSDGNTREVTIRSKEEDAGQKPFDGNGYYELKNKDGLPVRKGVFENGYLVDGKVYQYTSDGEVFRITHYKAGRVVKVEDLQD